MFKLERSTSAAGRLDQPFTYWNAAGIAAAIGFVLAVRVAGDPASLRALRAFLAAASVPLGLGVYLSFSRGALAAVAVGLLVLVALAPEGRAQLRSVAVLVCASAVAAFVANGLPTVKSLTDNDSGEGLLMLRLWFSCYRKPRRPTWPRGRQRQPPRLPVAARFETLPSWPWRRS